MPPLSKQLSYFTGVTKVQATDNQTLVITCSKPNAVMTALYVPILPEHIWSKVPDSKIDSWPKVPMVSSGPFQVTEVQNGKFVRLTRNPYYKDGFGVEPTVDEVLFAMYQTQDSLVADYKAGHLDAAIELDPGFNNSLKGVPGSTSVAAPSLGFHELGMNCYESAKSKGNPLLRDVRVRQAINWAIDKKAIAAAKKISAYLKDVGIGVTLQIMDENAFTNDNYSNADDDLYIWSWTADIDPGYILSVFTTGQILNGSDSEFSNPTYDKLYVQQSQAVDPAQRKQIIDQMQQILYRDSPYSILWYNVLIQAYRTDKWTGYSHVPVGAGGAPFRNMLRTTYIDLKPKVATTATDNGSSTGKIVAIVVAALVVIGVVAFVLLRRRPKSVETE